MNFNHAIFFIDMVDEQCTCLYSIRSSYYEDFYNRSQYATHNWCHLVWLLVFKIIWVWDHSRLPYSFVVGVVYHGWPPFSFVGRITDHGWFPCTAA